jgi:hypothetical protein
LLISKPAASIKATIWATAEPGTGIVAASTAILRPLLRKLYADVREKMNSYGTGTMSRKFSTQWNIKRDREESVIELTSADAKWDNNENLPRESVQSPGLHESPYDRISTEQARTGVGRIVLITAGQMVRTVPVLKK